MQFVITDLRDLCLLCLCGGLDASERGVEGRSGWVLDVLFCFLGPDLAGLHGCSGAR